MTEKESIDPFKPGEWKWWAGESDEGMMTIGPCDTRDEAINMAIQDGFGEWLDTSQEPPRWRNRFTVLEAKTDPLRLADWIGVDTALERADEALWDSDRVCHDYDEGTPFVTTPEQDADLQRRLRQACDEWQIAHVLTFRPCTFSRTRNVEGICIDALRTVADQGGADQ